VLFDESVLGERFCRVSPHRLEFFTLKLAADALAGERKAAIKVTSPRLTVSSYQTATSDLTSEGVRHLASGPVVNRR
jgi:type II secretory pathway component HofQ